MKRHYLTGYYIRAFGLYAIAIHADAPEGPSRLIVTRDPNAAGSPVAGFSTGLAFWFRDRAGARSVSKLAARQLRQSGARGRAFGLPPETVAARVAAVARSRRLTCTPHRETMARVQAALAEIETKFRESVARGDLKSWNQSIKASRQAGVDGAKSWGAEKKYLLRKTIDDLACNVLSKIEKSKQNRVTKSVTRASITKT